MKHLELKYRSHLVLKVDLDGHDEACIAWFLHFVRRLLAYCRKKLIYTECFKHVHHLSFLQKCSNVHLLYIQQQIHLTSLGFGEAVMQAEDDPLYKVLDVAGFWPSDKNHPVMGEAFWCHFLLQLSSVAQLQLHLHRALKKKTFTLNNTFEVNQAAEVHLS